MRMNRKSVSVRDIYSGYLDKGDDGVCAYGGRLDVRPPFQREFCYDGDKERKVIDSVMNGYPLGLIYWGEREDGTYEVIDGQQRTLSICRYIHGDFSWNGFYFHNLSEENKMRIMDYAGMDVKVCKGTADERLEWFKTINIQGTVLTEQELLNAAYAGPWLSDAKRYFSKKGCPAYRIAGDLLRGSANRQDYLETALSWISKGRIQDYMAEHQHDEDAKELWDGFRCIVDWVREVFPTYRREMKGLDWGTMYDMHGNEHHTAEMDDRVDALMADPEVGSKQGIYWYVLDNHENHLNLRAFDASTKRTVYERQGGVCPKCEREGLHKVWDISEMDADHIVRWKDGGRTVESNCRMLCIRHNRMN